MIDFQKYATFRKKQPLFTDFIRKMAASEVEWLLHSSADDALAPNPKQIERFHRVLIDNGIIKQNAVCSTWESDLKLLAIY